ncbi:MAG: imidazolonepropionase [Clostridium sp.]
MSNKETVLLIRNAKQLLTMQGNKNSEIGLIEHGSVLIKKGLIEAVGTESEIDVLVKQLEAEGTQVDIIDAAGKAVMPGLVDCHTHVTFGGSRVKAYSVTVSSDDPDILAKKGIPAGIYASVNMTRDLPKEELKAQTKKRLENMILHGTTTIEGKSGYGLTMDSELKMLTINRELNTELPMDISSTFLGAHGWAEGMKKEDYMDLLCKEMIPRVAAEHLADCNDIWCDEGHYTAKECERILTCGRDYGLAPRIHTDAYSYIGGSDLAADMHMLSADHLNYTPVPLFRKLAEANVTGVVLPAIDFAVKHPKPFDPRPMLDAGMDLGLATNCCPGCWSESMFFIIILACRDHGMSAEEALRASTRGAAKAMGLLDRGVLEKGKKADLLILDVDTFEDVIYKYGRNPVETVIKDGKVTVKNGIIC